MIFVALMLAASIASAQTPEDSADQAARRWLDMAASSGYAGAYDAISPTIRQTMTREEFVTKTAKDAPAVGTPQRRSLDMVSPAGPGAYLVSYDTVFDGGSGAVKEYVLVYPEADGIWRVASYRQGISLADLF